MKKHFKKIILFSLIFTLVGCAYYNTFFNAKQNFKQGREKQKNTKSEKIPSDVRKHYASAIEKSWKLIDVYGDSSDYADDALFLIGKSHYQLEEYSKAERILNQFLLKYLNSEFIPEVKLWLGKSYIKLERDDEALALFNELFEQKISKRIAAESFYYRGTLNFERSNYEDAIQNFTKCIQLDPEEEIAGGAQFKIGQSFYNLDQYENAITNFDKVLDYDLPPVEHYDALMEKANSYSKIGDLANAEATLKYMLRDQRFKDRYAMIETKLGNIYEFDKEYTLAREYYESVIERYPRTEGAALAYFYLGQLYEKEYGIMDSAKVKYENVKKTFAKSEAAEEAEKRRKTLAEYLDLRKKITKDINDLYRLERGDSSLVDSVVTGQDTVETRFTGLDVPQDSLQDTTAVDGKLQDTEKKVVQTKMAVSRDPFEVESSLLKNRFAMAEFFLFKYQQYDSALYAYENFIEYHTDSLLTPKAFYALFYINNDIKSKPEDAAAWKDSIVTKYPESIYAKKLSGHQLVKEEKSDPRQKALQKRYREAENLLDSNEYRQAIGIFTEIADQDSGTTWAEKARYATAYIYEKWLRDTTEAIQSYEILAAEYPNTEYGRIAKNKIKVPETIPDTLSQSADSLRTGEERDRTPMIDDTLPADDKIPESGDQREQDSERRRNNRGTADEPESPEKETSDRRQ